MEMILDRYRPGYPRYAALLSAHPSFQNFRRFNRVRMRLILLKQDEIILLEKQLDDLDSAEKRRLFLGCMRLDQNEDRRNVMHNLQVALSEYDSLLDQTRRAALMSEPANRELQNLRNWTAGTGSISREETDYLQRSEDLGSLGGPVDKALTYSESCVEDCIFWIDRIMSRFFPRLKQYRYRISADDNILLLGPYLRVFSRVIAVIAVTLVIIVPTIFIPSIPSSGARIIASVFSAVVFLAVVCFFTTARIVDVFASGASYAAVLVAVTTAMKDPSDQCCPGI